MSLVERTESEGRPKSPRSLSVYDRMNNPLEAVKQLGKAIALSQMFGPIDCNQGEIVALECMASRLTPLSLKRRYHITKFGLIQQASWTMSEFQKAGGHVREISRTPDCACAELTLGSDQYTVTLKWEDAKNEPFPYEGKEKEIIALLEAKKKPKLKAKYATPLSRAQMLWWRLIGDGIRAHWPEINGGAYSAEELGIDEDNESPDEIVDGEFETVVESQPVAAAEVVQGGASVEQQPAAEPTQAESPAPAVRADLLDYMECTGEQSTAIRDAFAELQLSEQQIAGILKKRSVNVIRSLSHAQAADLLVGLQIKLDQLRAMPKPPPAVPTDAEPPMQTPATIEVAGPCQPEQEAEIKRLLVELNQVVPGTVDKFRAKLREAGYAKIGELSHAQAIVLTRALQVKQLDQFFAESLAPKQRENSQPKN